MTLPAARSATAAMPATLSTRTARSEKTCAMEPGASACGIGDGAEERERRIARVEPRVLDHDGNVGSDDARVIRTAGDGFRVAQVVEAQVQRAARRHDQAIGTGRLAVGEIERDANLRLGVARVEDAGGLVAFERAIA